MKAAGEGAKAIVYIGTAGLSCGIAPNTCACNQVTCHGDGPNMTITVHGTGNFTGINYETKVAHESNRGDYDYGALCRDTFCVVERTPIDSHHTLACGLNGNSCPVAFIIYQTDKMGIDSASPDIGEGLTKTKMNAAKMTKVMAKSF